MDFKQPEPDSKNYKRLISYIEDGRIKIPKFQRDFVWSIDKTAKLLDSVLKGYPIGTFIIWQTSERMSDIKEIGNFKLPETPRGDSVMYVLDGQQRITSLFAAYRGEQVRNTKYSDIVVNLDKGLDENNDQIITAKPTGEKHIQLSKVLNFDRDMEKKLAEQFSDDDRDLISTYHKAFENYDFPIVVLQNADIDSAIEVFTRLNTGGKPLTVFEIMSARTYDEGQRFDMQAKWEDFIKEVKAHQYEGISSTVILSLLSLVISPTQECKRKTILALDKQEIIDNWEGAISALKDGITYFKQKYRIPVSRLLPYDLLLVPFAYFYFRNKGKDPESDQRKYLKEFFWKMSLSHRYSSSTESRLAHDVKKRIDLILAHQRPDYADIKVDLDSPQTLIDTEFNAGKSYCKAVLCLLANKQPKDFSDNRDVPLDNAYLKRADSKNYHHFFPKKFLEDKKIGNRNSLVNITLVRDRTNKSIKDKKPSKYIGAFREKDSKIKKTLKSHLIDIDGFGIENNNYKSFLEARAQRIFDELKKRINPR